MNILFVSNLFPDKEQPYRGLDNVTVLHHLRELGHEVRVISPRPQLRSRSFQAREQDACFTPKYLPARYVPKLGGLFNHRLMERALRPALRRLKSEWSWDVLLGSWLFPDGWAVCRANETVAPGVPATLIAQGSDVHQYLKSAPRRKAILQACEASAHIITRSRSLGQMLSASGVPETKICPIHNGVDTSLFHGGCRQEARQKLGIASDGPWLLFVGNLLPVKDPDFLIRAFRQLSGDPDRRLNLAIAGKGPLRTSLESQVDQLGLAQRVRLLGPLGADEIATWMRAADLLCMTSRNEGLPNVILEAQACGLPVVATRVGGIHEVVMETWQGALSNPGDLAGWCDAVNFHLSRQPERERLSQWGMTRTWPSAAKRYEEVLQLPLAWKDQAAERTPLI